MTRPGDFAWYHWDGADLVLQLHIQPRSSREGFAGISAQGLKIRLTATPVEGEANLALQRFLAKEFGTPKAEILLEKGQTGRHKRVRISSPRRLPPDLALKKP